MFVFYIIYMHIYSNEFTLIITKDFFVKDTLSSMVNSNHNKAIMLHNSFQGKMRESQLVL